MWFAKKVALSRYLFYYYLHEKSFTDGYRFMWIELEDKQKRMNRVLDDLSELKAASQAQSKLLDRMVALSDELAAK